MLERRPRRDREGRWGLAGLTSCASHAVGVWWLVLATPHAEVVEHRPGDRERMPAPFVVELVSGSLGVAGPPEPAAPSELVVAASPPRMGHHARAAAGRRRPPAAVRPRTAVYAPVGGRGHDAGLVGEVDPHGELSPAMGAARSKTAPVGSRSDDRVMIASMPATIVPVPRQPPSEPDHRRDRRAEISAREASYLRTHEKFPSLPGSLWRLGRSYRVTARICVSREGRVSGVAIVEGTAADVNRILGKAMRAWRYRPRVVAGLPRPFCHLMNVQYSLR